MLDLIGFHLVWDTIHGVLPGRIAGFALLLLIRLVSSEQLSCLKIPAEKYGFTLPRWVRNVSLKKQAFLCNELIYCTLKIVQCA